MMTRRRAVGRRKCQQGTPRARASTAAARWSSGVEMKTIPVSVWKFVMKFDDGWLDGWNSMEGDTCATALFVVQVSDFRFPFVLTITLVVTH